MDMEQDLEWTPSMDSHDQHWGYRSETTLEQRSPPFTWLWSKTASDYESRWTTLILLIPKMQENNISPAFIALFQVSLPPYSV